MINVYWECILDNIETEHAPSLSWALANRLSPLRETSVVERNHAAVLREGFVVERNPAVALREGFVIERKPTVALRKRAVVERKCAVALQALLDSKILLFFSMTTDECYSSERSEESHFIDNETLHCVEGNKKLNKTNAQQVPLRGI